MDQTPLISIASGHPLIDIDLTAVVQFVLFLLVYLIANALLFQPYLALRERRKAGIEGSGPELSTAAFRRPSGPQLTLFGS